MRKEKKIVAGEKYFKNRMNRRLTHFLFRKKNLLVQFQHLSIFCPGLDKFWLNNQTPMFKCLGESETMKNLGGYYCLLCLMCLKVAYAFLGKNQENYDQT